MFAFVFDPGSTDTIYNYDPNEDSVWLDPKLTAVTGRNEDTSNDGTYDQAIVTLARYGQTQEVVVKGANGGRSNHNGANDESVAEHPVRARSPTVA